MKMSQGYGGTEAMGDGAGGRRDCRRHLRRDRDYLRQISAAPTFWQGMAFLFIGGPLAVLFASWPIALGQGLRALADVAEYTQRQQSGLGRALGVDKMQRAIVRVNVSRGIPRSTSQGGPLLRQWTLGTHRISTVQRKGETYLATLSVLKFNDLNGGDRVPSLSRASRSGR